MSHYKKPTLDEFELEGDRVLHKPTGAWFEASPGRPEIAHKDFGTAGNTQPNGDDYRPHEIEEIAARMLRNRLTSG
jgi:hypothetical protein